jgi:hypothetical protein
MKNIFKFKNNWPLSDTDNNFKFSKGDRVRIIDGTVLKNPTGRVIKSEFVLKKTIYIVELYGGLLRFPESALIHNNPDDERDWKLKKLLND